MLGVGMAQWLRAFATPQEDLSYNKKSGMALTATPTSWTIETRGTVGLDGHQPNSNFTERPCLKGIVWRMTKNNTLLGLSYMCMGAHTCKQHVCVHMCVCTCACVHTHAQSIRNTTIISKG